MRKGLILYGGAIEDMPLGKLPDGRPYFAPLGQVVIDPDSGLVQCHLCGGWFTALAPGHLRLGHGWNHLEYKLAFGLSKHRVLQAAALRNKRREVMERLLDKNESVRRALAEAQATLRKGDHAERLRSAHRKPQTLDHRRRSQAAAASGTEAWQTKARQLRVARARALGFPGIREYLIDRYLRLQFPLADIQRELRVGQATLYHELQTWSICDRGS
jgi:hypothetical protein